MSVAFILCSKLLKKIGMGCMDGKMDRQTERWVDNTKLPKQYLTCLWDGIKLDTLVGAKKFKGEV